MLAYILMCTLCPGEQIGFSAVKFHQEKLQWQWLIFVILIEHKIYLSVTRPVTIMLMQIRRADAA